VTARRCNPRHMSEEARLAELGALLARAFRRLQQISQNRVAESSDSEPVCAPAELHPRGNSKECT
jgi:hypothetical protein